MSNIFKSNNRFASLAEFDENYKNNQFKNKLYNNKHNIFNNKTTKTETKIIDSFFPALTAKNSEKDTDNNIHPYSIKYAETLKRNTNSEHNDTLPYLPPGHILYKRDSKTGETIAKYSQPHTIHAHIPKIHDENILFQKMDDYLNKSEQQFINMYGYEEWEKRYMLPSVYDGYSDTDSDDDDGYDSEGNITISDYDEQYD